MPAPPPQTDVDVSTEQVAPMLPAHPLPGERERGAKADWFDDYRWSRPDTFGITAPPAADMRAVAQWEPAQALLLGWTGSFPETVAGIVKAARPIVEMFVVHDGWSSRSQFESAMSAHGVSTAGLRYLNTSLDSMWIRDYGPLSIKGADGRVAFVDPKYYHGRAFDDAVPTEIARSWGVDSYRQPLSWEGGTYIANGVGGCIYSQGVYWYGGASQGQIHEYQRAYMGCKTNTVVHPLQDEGTTHSDMFAKLVAKDHALVGDYASWQDPGNAQVLDANAQILAAAGYAVTRLPMPSNSGRQVWRTYANSLLINGRNLVPVYSDDRNAEAEALAVWQDAMPGWTHVPIDSTGLIQWSGAVHCITMTVPAGDLRSAEDPALICGGDYTCTPSVSSSSSATTSPSPATTSPSPASSAGTPALSCAEMGYEGCCDGQTLTYCDGGQIKVVGCGSCGWDASKGWYDCQQSGADPSGDHPLSCGGEAVAPSPASTSTSTPTPTSTSTEPAADACGGLGYEGCCDGAMLTWCESGQRRTLDCQTSGCGWNDAASFYDCSQSGAGPAEFPLACP